MGDYVGDMTPHAKKLYRSAPKAAPAKGWNVKVNLGYILFIFYIEFLARPWRPHFKEDRHRFCAR